MEFPEIWPYLSWNIKGVSDLNRILRRAIFVNGYKFYVELQKQLFRNPKEDSLEVYLIDSKVGSKDDCRFIMSTYLKDSRGKNHFCQQTHVIRTNFKYARLIWRVTLLDLFENGSLNWKTNLHFVCMFGPESEYQNGFQGDNSHPIYLCSYNDHLEKFSLEISNLYAPTSYGDVILKCDGQEIVAHKNILSVRSPVFRKLFKNQLVQQEPTEVTISGVDYCSLTSLLSYLYSGYLFFHHQSIDGAMQLYEAAQKYEVVGLKEECRKFLVGSLKKDTACRFLLFASEKKDKEFLNNAISFISKSDIFISKRWIEFTNEHPDLALKAYFKYLDNYILTLSNLEYIHKLL